jgi:hypothetical protein
VTVRAAPNRLDGYPFSANRHNSWSGTKITYKERQKANRHIYYYILDSNVSGRLGEESQFLGK